MMAKISNTEKQQMSDALLDWMVPGASKVTHEEAVAYIQSEWIRTLTQLWDAIGKVADKKQLAVYIKELGCIPLGVLEQVVSRLLADHTYHTVPTIGEIWKVIKEDFGDKESLAFWTPYPMDHKYIEQLEKEKHERAI